MVSDKGAGSLALQKIISTKTESSEASKVLRGKRSIEYVDRHTDSGRERVAKLHPWGNLYYFYGVSLLYFLRPIILICLVHSPYLVYLKVFQCIHINVLAKMDFSGKVYG